MPQQGQIEGLPPGAVVKPIGGQIEGLPAGAVVKPLDAAPADPQAVIKEKYGIPLDLDLNRGYFDPWNLGPIGVYEKSGKKIDPRVFSQAAQEWKTQSQPEEKGFLAGSVREAGNIFKGMFDVSQGGPAGATPPGTGFTEYVEGIKQHGPLGAVPIVGPMAAQRIEQAKTDPSGALGAGAVDIGMLALGYKGLKAGLKGEVPQVPRLLREPVKTITEIGRKPQIAQSVVKEALSLPPKAVSGAEDIFRAAAPTGSKPGFRTNLYAATGDLAEIGRNLDLSKYRGGMWNPDMRPRATVNAINDYLGKMYETERAPQIQKHAANPVNSQMGVDAGEGLRHIQRTGGNAEIRALAEKAAKSKTMTLAEMDKLARTVNQELLSYEQMTPEMRLQAGVTNKRFGSLKALDRTLSERINGELTSRGEVGLTKYERRFAALSQIRNQLQSRLNAVELQRSNVVGRTARAVFGGKAGIASASQAAIADVNIGRILENGFKTLAESGVKPDLGTAAPAPPIRGFLGSGAKPLTAGEGESFVRGVSAQPAQRDIRGLLPPQAGPERPVRMPAQSATGSVEGMPASATTARGEGGRFTRAYTSASGPQTPGNFMGEIRTVNGARWTWTGERWWRMR